MSAGKAFSQQAKGNAPLICKNYTSVIFNCTFPLFLIFNRNQELQTPYSILNTTEVA